MSSLRKGVYNAPRAGSAPKPQPNYEDEVRDDQFEALRALVAPLVEGKKLTPLCEAGW